MDKKNTLTHFYSTSKIAEVSKKGYYKEKISFFLHSLEQLSKNKSVKILDIACNDGLLTRKYSSYGEVTGVELNRRAAISCKKNGVKCLNIDIMDMPEKYNHTFDIVLAGDIIEHIFTTDSFLKKIHQLLVPKGTLLLTTPNVASLARRAFLLLGVNPFLEYSTQLPYPEFNVGHIRYYTKKDLYDQLALLGFKDINIYGDKINLIPPLSIPYFVARHFPSLSRNLMVTCTKP